MRRNEYTPSDTLITDFCDTDSKWGPLLFLRPARSQRFSVYRCMALAILLGGGFGALGNILLLLIARALERPALPIFAFPLLLTAFYFLASCLVLAPSWNRRASLLTNGRA
ncbi:MAG TPA: hypothetical protein VKP30_13335 [Polyangiaceae bacterium]|nr:hypothetical protein [Polyangiaceae bacterium]